LPRSFDPADKSGAGVPDDAMFSDQTMVGLEGAGLFKRVRLPFPVPVKYSKSSDHVSSLCRFGDRAVQLQCPEQEILDAIRASLGPLLDAGPVNQGTTGDVVALQYHGDGFGVFVNARPVFGQCEFPLARHFVMREIAISLAGRAQVSAVFHAGAAGTREKTFVFAADSGSGKSTLTAALAANGFVYYSDDQVALVGEEGRIAAFPTRIGLKSGSWAVPELSSYGVESLAPAFVGDGYIKPLLPERVGDPGNKPQIAAFVFPAYSAQARFELTELSSLEAMQRLIASGSRLTGRYPTILPLVQTLARVPAYALTYNNTLQAMDAVSGLLAK
jgi:hypothetical protein